MIRRHPFAEMMLLAMAGSVECVVLSVLVAWESEIPRHSARSFEGSLTQGGGRSAPLPWAIVLCPSGAENLLSVRFSVPPGSSEKDVGHDQSLKGGVKAWKAFTGGAHRNRSPQANGEISLPELSPPLGIPPVPFPEGNRPTRERIDLGRQLFFDPRLSRDGSTSCASCHNPEQAFADNEVTSHGIDGKKGIRNTPTVINAAFQPYQFWDGRASSLEDQALLPLENPAEMGSSVPIIVDRLNQLPQYRDAFRRVFGVPVTRENLAKALASFERTILAGDSAYDRYAAGNPTALSLKAAEGMKLFEGKAHCRLCHQGYNFSDGLFHSLGVGWNGNGFGDEGRSAVTGIIKDRGAFKTPTLRQVAQTPPYMHDGSLASLEAVVDFYDRGGKPNPHLDPLIQPLRLTLQEKEALVEFLRSLNGKVSFYRSCG